MVEGEQRGTVWPEDVPEDVLTGGGESPSAAPSAPSVTPPSGPIAAEEPRRTKHGHLKLVE